MRLLWCNWWDYGWDFCDVIDETMDLNIVMWLCVRFLCENMLCYIAVDIFVMLWNMV
jgi:high-affinity nickel permease